MTTSFQTTRARSDLRSGMAVTPVMDVLVVLLVIFMLSHAMGQLVPFGKPEQRASPIALAPPLTLRLHANGTASVNGQPVPLERLQPYLTGILQSRTVKLLFIQPSGDLPYSAVISAAALARGAGARTVAFRPGLQSAD